MPMSITNMPGGMVPTPTPPMPTAMPANPGNMPGGAPLPQSGMPPQMAQPGSQAPKFITEDQGNGTLLIRATGPNGAPGPVVKVIPMPKPPKQPGAPH
jgi:hypothetical protein